MNEGTTVDTKHFSNKQEIIVYITEILGSKKGLNPCKT